MQCGCIHYDDDTWDECDIHYSSCCMDCERHITEFKEYYMVTDCLWESVTINNEVYGLLCIGCLESRLGRELVLKDFTDYPVNSVELTLRQSNRQKMRMGYRL